MSVLTVLGAVSALFVAAFTWRAATRSPTPGQTPRSSIIEAWLNIVAGFSFNYGINFLILPMVGAHLTASNNFALGWVYTAVSILRQYAIRRWFNRRLHAIAQRVSCDPPTDGGRHA